MGAKLSLEGELDGACNDFAVLFADHSRQNRCFAEMEQLSGTGIALRDSGVGNGVAACAILA